VLAQRLAPVLLVKVFVWVGWPLRRICTRKVLPRFWIVAIFASELEASVCQIVPNRLF
jgi:hypothetical protein